METEKETNEIIGKWKMTYSVFSSDSHIDTNWIEFAKGNYFRSNNSVFWKNKSFRPPYLEGNYHVVVWTYLLSRNENDPYLRALYLMAGTDTVCWVFELNNEQMDWRPTYYERVEYNWTRMK
jgi:hypothetical protein